MLDFYFLLDVLWAGSGGVAKSLSGRTVLREHRQSGTNVVVIRLNIQQPAVSCTQHIMHVAIYTHLFAVVSASIHYYNHVHVSV